jgi:PKD repeat protein
MKKSCRLFFLMFMVLSLTVLSQAEVRKLHHSQGQAEMPSVLVLPDGRILVVFNEGHHFNTDAQMLYLLKNPDTGRWVDTQQAFNKSRSSAFIQMALDDDGIVHVALMDGNASANRDIFYSNYNPTTDKWANKSRIYDSTGLNSTWPRLKIQDDILYILWTHNYDSSVGQTDLCMVTNPIGGSWPVAKNSRITISNTGWSASVHTFFDIQDDRICAIWMDDNHGPGNWNMYYSEGHNQNGNWTFDAYDHVWPSKINQYYPALVMDDAGTVHVMFSNKSGPFFYAQKPVGGNWTKPKAISSGGCSFNLIPYMIYKHGLIHTVWRQTTTDHEGLFYGRALPDGTWAEPIMIDDGMQFPQYPVLDLDAQGTVHVVWSDGDPDHPRHIWYADLELPGEAPQAVIQASKTKGLVPLTVQFDGSKSKDPDGKITEYRWDFGDGSSATGKKVSHTYTEEGTFTANLTVIDSDIRAGTAQVTIEVSSGVPEAVITTSATQGMIPLTVVFDGSGSKDFDGEIVLYEWAFSDGTQDAGPSVTRVFENGGHYTATLTVTDNEGKTGTDSVEITAYEQPVAIFTAEPTVGVPPLTVSFNASDSYDPDGSINTYRWDYGDGQNALSKKENHTYSSPGNFMVVLTVVDNDKITATATKTIMVLDRPLPPVNIGFETFHNKSFLHSEYLNQVTWQENSENSGLFDVALYRIYRKVRGEDDSTYALIGEVAGTTYTYQDRGLESALQAAGYSYALTSVDADGNESIRSDSSLMSGVAGRSLPRTGFRLTK